MQDYPETEITHQPGKVFPRYFSLEEAAARLPEIRAQLADAFEEVTGAKNDIVLYKRILHIRKKRTGHPPTDEELVILKRKYHRYEDMIDRWIARFEKRGIILRDVEQGLVDFPYYAKSVDQDYLLCWRKTEDGIFYFHELQTGFTGRKPISLLPD